MNKIYIIVLLLLLGSCKRKEETLIGVWEITEVDGGLNGSYYDEHISTHENTWEFKADKSIIMTGVSGEYKGTWAYSSDGDEYRQSSEDSYGEPLLINCYNYTNATFYLSSNRNDRLELVGNTANYYFKR